MVSPDPQVQSASDIDHRRTADIPPTPPDVPFPVLTPHGWEPYFPPPDSAPPPSPEAHVPENDNPLNPKGGPSLSYPQQATPLTSQQGVLAPEDLLDENAYRELVTVQNGLAPDDPRNPKGTPDYIVEGLTDPDADTIIHQLNPATTPVSLTPITLEVLGQGFAPDAEILLDGVALPTTFVTPNRLTAALTPDIAGVKQITVGDATAVPFEVTNA